jgi:hypothetical protein
VSNVAPGSTGRKLSERLRFQARGLGNGGVSLRLCDRTWPGIKGKIALGVWRIQILGGTTTVFFINGYLILSCAETDLFPSHVKQPRAKETRSLVG